MDDILARQILNELIQIRRLLAMLSQDKRDTFNKEIEEKYLTTDQRQKMYEMFDGENSLKAVANEVKLSSEGVRKFAVQLEQAGLVEFVQGDKTKNPKRIF
jgi:hypothetical protein